MRLGTIGVALLAGLVACGGDAKDPAASPDRIKGSITIRTDPDDASITDSLQLSEARFAVGAPCSGDSIADGYSDLVPGAGVTVKNESGEIIATGALTAGTWIKRACKMGLDVPDVPVAKFYEVEVTRRGAQRFSRQQLVDDAFIVDLTLG